MQNKLELLWERTYLLRQESSGDHTDVGMILKELSDIEGHHGEASLLRGYLAYHFPSSVTESIDIEKEFKETLRIDPEDITARLYLGHFYYDCRRFNEALEELVRVDRKRYEAVGQYWRSLKILELTIGAKIHLKPREINSDEVQDFIDLLSTTEADNCAIPLELVDALIDNRKALVETWSIQCLRRIVESLRVVMKRIAPEGTLKDKLELLESIDIGN